MQIFQGERSKLAIAKDTDFLNQSVSYHMKTLKKKSDKPKIMLLLQKLSEYSVKTLGVSWMSNKTMARLIGVSVRTVQRYTKELMELGIISKIYTARNKNRGQTSNTYLIIPVLKLPSISKKVELCHGGCHTNESILETNYKQEKDICISEEKLFHLFKLKLKDKSISHGSSYVQKVVETLFNQFKKEEEERHRYERMKQMQQEPVMQRPDYDWLNSFDASNPKDRRAWWEELV